ncbi:phospholipase A2 inhibitor beta-like [Ambystoma mexicanum]|uniref:phospholipase A2 inhibitor beta-like n=1 Tax=Ambystoma mexicanum TaxID=8296 RepID=UPI0037E94B5A
MWHKSHATFISNPFSLSFLAAHIQEPGNSCSFLVPVCESAEEPRDLGGRPKTARKRSGVKKLKMHRYHIFWILLHASCGEMELPSLCQTLCVCKDRSKFVNCSGTNGTHIPSFPPATEFLDLSKSELYFISYHALKSLWRLQVLLLSENDIRTIKDGAFSSMDSLQKLDLSRNHIASLGLRFSSGLESLKDLSLAFNHLQALHHKSLQHLENLQKLNACDNNISHIEIGAFRSLTRLRQLQLQNNHLSSLHSGLFSLLQYLEILNVEGNQITVIAPGVFTSLNSLAVLNLLHNQLEHVRFKTFLNLQTHSTHILLAHNPWVCDCDLQRVFSKLHSVRRLILDDYENVTCSEPHVLRGLPLASVDSQLCIAETVTVLVITFTVFVTVVAAIFMAERNRKKRTGKHWSEDSEITYESQD